MILVDGKTMMQSPVVTLQINHKAPIWAKYYQIVRSTDLTYGKYIQMLIQEVVDVNDDDAQDYLDLVVGSLFTYQKIHPNSPLTYDFAKGDRLRLIKKTDPDEYYPFFETEVIAYNSTVTQNIQDNVITNGTATVTVTESSEDNIGKIILIDGYEREIVSAPTGTTYLLNNVIGDSTAKTYLNYDLIDRRGTIRIRKPNTIEIEDDSIVELYKPSSLSNPLGAGQFYEFQKKFQIINAGTEDAYHSGSTQNQTASQPAIVEISEGTAYVRNREMPISNSFPGTQIRIEVVEDESYSDFYNSLMNDNGRVNVEDTGDGEVHFGSRMRFSNNFIEDTRINGLNDFDNLDREDYYDQYGDFKLTKFETNRIIGFKELRTTSVPVDERITQSNNGVALNVNSAKLLNPIQYYAWEGGIGNNPESFVSNGTSQYFVSANSGVVLRLGGNGEEPLSVTYFLDNEIREILRNAIKNGAKIFGGFDRQNANYNITIEGYNQFIFNDGFGGWRVSSPNISESTTFELVTPPSNGTAILSGFDITYTPDEDYIGNDTFSYRALINGVWETKNVCIEIKDSPNTNPSPFDFTDVTGAEINTVYESNSQNITGINMPASISIANGEYQINGGAWTASNGTVNNGDTVKVRRMSAPTYETTVSCTLVVGDYSTTFQITTRDNSPTPFTFTPVTDAEINTQYESNTITISGL